VVKVDANHVITDFVEKPQEFVSDLAIIGIYYFKDGENLKKELQYLLEQDIKDKGEYQLTTAMENMKRKGLKLYPGEVEIWLDCGNKNATVDTNRRILEIEKNEELIHPSTIIENSTILQPCYFGADVEIRNSVVGPYVSIGKKTNIKECIIKNSIIQSNTIISNRILENSMIGNHAVLNGHAEDLSLGDFSTSN